MKTKLIQKIKEELKKYCWAENGCTGDSSDKKLIGFIEKAISQSKEELVEEIKKRIDKNIYQMNWHEYGYERMNTAKEQTIKMFKSMILADLEDLNKK